MAPTWWWLLLAALAVQRLAETRLAARHERALAARGGRRVAADGYAGIVALHAAFLLGAAAEAAFAPWTRAGWWTWPLLVAFVAGQGLRLWAIGTLGARWTTRVWVVPGEAPVARGPYRWLRHPNYAGVALELAALPLAVGAVATAVLASGANALLLRRRVRIEERALAEAADEPARALLEEAARGTVMFERYECPSCHAEFRTVDSLREHGLRTHAGASEATR